MIGLVPGPVKAGYERVVDPPYRALHNLLPALSGLFY